MTKRGKENELEITFLLFFVSKTNVRKIFSQVIYRPVSLCRTAFSLQSSMISATLQAMLHSK